MHGAVLTIGARPDLLDRRDQARGAIGDDQPYVTALIVLDDEIAPEWAAANGVEVPEGTSLADHPRVREELEAAVESANSRLARIEQMHAELGQPWGAIHVVTIRTGL